MAQQQVAGSAEIPAGPAGSLSSRHALLGLCLLQSVLWSLAPMLAHSAPPLDVVENTALGPEWVISTFKNPTLSTALLEIARLATGAVGWPAYLLSQACICLTFLFIFELGRDGLGAPRALAGTALLTGIVYFSWTSPEFNQDILSMPLWAGLILALWRAVETGRLGWWLALAVFGALGLYAKLAMNVLLLVGGLWLLFDARARARLATPGPWIALLVFAAFVAPLVHWLVTHDFQPLTYATGRGRTNSLSGPGFLLAQVEAAVPLAIMLGLAVRQSRPALAVIPEPDRSIDPRYARYLLAMLLGPLIVTLIATLLLHTGVKRMWGVPMLSTLGLVAVMLAGPRLNADARRLIVRTASVLLVLVPIAYTATMGLWPNLTGGLLRQNWPQAEIATRMRGIWAGETSGKPLGIVAGDVTNWIAGLIALAGPGRPPASVFTEANPQKSPWVTAERLKAEGALVVWQERGDGPPESLKTLIGNRPRRVEAFAVPHAPKVPPITIGYAVVPPG